MKFDARRNPIILGALMLTSVAILASGCAGNYPKHRTEVIGAWEAHEDGHVVRLDLNADGTLELQDVPREALSSDPYVRSLHWDDTVDVTADWTFDEASSAPYSTPLIFVTFDDSDRVGDLAGLFLLPDEDGLHLWYGDIDSDEGLTFRKVHAEE